MSGRFRKKPVEVEAVQCFPNAPLPEGFLREDENWRRLPDGGIEVRRNGHNAIAEVAPGDWLIREPDGVLVTCWQRHFAETYEPAPPHPPALDAETRERLERLADMLDALGCDRDRWPAFLRNLASHQSEPQQRCDEKVGDLEERLAAAENERDRWEQTLVAADRLREAYEADDAPEPQQEGRGERLVEFVQKVASQRNAICKADHHAATCSGAVGLAEQAAHLLSGMGIELKFPRREWLGPCWLCGNGDYVSGQVWIDGAHKECREAVAGTTIAPHLTALDLQGEEGR